MQLRPSPDQSGEFSIGRIFGGQFCMRVPTEYVCPGDYIEFYRQGMRVRQVRTVHRGRKHKFVQFVPSKYNAFRSQKVKLQDIKGVWRIQGELKLWKDPGLEEAR